MILCLVSSFDVNAARRPLAEHPASIESAEDTPIRVPRKFREDSRTRRLHIENQTGFDGKVEKIHINSEEDHPRIRLYGMPAKILANSGRVERMLQKESEEEVESGSRIARAIEAYGKSKENLDSNGRIERVRLPLPASGHAPALTETRVARSIEAEPKQASKEGANGDTDDLDAQDSKVFRPLFVYRQQIAKRQQRGRNQIHGYPSGWKPCQERRPAH